MSPSLTLIGVLGRGGFGTVYLARRATEDGWSREVAVKLLDPSRADEGALRRFRDEARILGLVRDRAVVSAEPPVRLREGWAVVMEYVPGRTLAELLEVAPPPPAGALELIEEVARALAHLGEATGPDGRPLGLVHRDLKPANLQLTRAGEVKILDFGIAHVSLATREASTTRAVVGTPGFIAPERLIGEDGPAGDVYALGVILQRMLGETGPPAVAITGAGPVGAPAPRALAPSPAAALATAMTAYVPSDRPTAREVERRARALRAGMAGPGLREWCEAHVPSTPTLGRDGLVGAVLTEGAPASRPAGWRRPAAMVGALLLALTWLAWTASTPTAQDDAPPLAAAAVTAPGPAAVPPGAPPTPASETAPAPNADAAASARPSEPPPSRPAPPEPRQAVPSLVTPAPTPPTADPPPAAPPPTTTPPPVEPPAPQPPRPTPVGLRGDAAAATAVGASGRYRLPADLPAGRYRVEVAFPDAAPFTVPKELVVGDAPLTVDCRLRFNGCSVVSSPTR